MENELKKEEDNLVQEEKKFEDAKKDVEELKLNSINDLDANIIKKQVFFKFKDVTYNPIDSKLMSDYKILTENEYNSLVSTFNLTANDSKKHDIKFIEEDYTFIKNNKSKINGVRGSLEHEGAGYIVPNNPNFGICQNAITVLGVEGRRGCPFINHPVYFSTSKKNAFVLIEFEDETLAELETEKINDANSTVTKLDQVVKDSKKKVEEVKKKVEEKKKDEEAKKNNASNQPSNAVNQTAVNQTAVKKEERKLWFKLDDGEISSREIYDNMGQKDEDLNNYTILNDSVKDQFIAKFGIKDSNRKVHIIKFDDESSKYIRENGEKLIGMGGSFLKRPNGQAQIIKDKRSYWVACARRIPGNCGPQIYKLFMHNDVNNKHMFLEINDDILKDYIENFRLFFKLDTSQLEDNTIYNTAPNKDDESKYVNIKEEKVEVFNKKFQVKSDEWKDGNLNIIFDTDAIEFLKENASKIDGAKNVSNSETNTWLTDGKATLHISGKDTDSKVDDKLVVCPGSQDYSNCIFKKYQVFKHQDANNFSMYVKLKIDSNTNNNTGNNKSNNKKSTISVSNIKSSMKKFFEILKTYQESGSNIEGNNFWEECFVNNKIDPGKLVGSLRDSKFKDLLFALLKMISYIVLYKMESYENDHGDNWKIEFLQDFNKTIFNTINSSPSGKKLEDINKDLFKDYQTPEHLFSLRTNGRIVDTYLGKFEENGGGLGNPYNLDIGSFIEVVLFKLDDSVKKIFTKIITEKLNDDNTYIEVDNKPTEENIKIIKVNGKIYNDESKWKKGLPHIFIKVLISRLTNQHLENDNVLAISWEEIRHMFDFSGYFYMILICILSILETTRNNDFNLIHIFLAFLRNISLVKKQNNSFNSNNNLYNNGNTITNGIVFGTDLTLEKFYEYLEFDIDAPEDDSEPSLDGDEDGDDIDQAKLADTMKSDDFKNFFKDTTYFPTNVNDVDVTIDSINQPDGIEATVLYEIQTTDDLKTMTLKGKLREELTKKIASEMKIDERRIDITFSD